MAVSIIEMFTNVTVAEDFAKQLEKAEILNVNLKIAKKSIVIDIQPTEIINKYELGNYIESIRQNYCLNELIINTKYSISQFSTDYLPNLVYIAGTVSPPCKPLLLNCNAEFSDGVFLITGVNGGYEILEKNRCAQIMKEAIKKEFGLDIQVVLEKRETTEKEIEDYHIKKLEKEQKLAAKALSDISPKPVSSTGEKAKKAPAKGVLFGKAISGEPVTMNGLTEESGRIVLEGTVFSVEVREIRGDKKIIIFDITDNIGSMTCKVFADKTKAEKAEAGVKNGAYLRVRGDMEYDKYSRELCLSVINIELLDKPLAEERKDTCEEKRVELHLHTKMSAMDAMSSVGDMVGQASKWGHKAIAVTDHGVVQSFPDAFAAGKKHGVKILYGVEGYLVNDIEYSSESACNSDEMYVVFDIETTGLNPINDKITEIGAVKIVNGVKVGTFSELINPGIPIPEVITELTGITDEMLEDKPDIRQILPKFLEFCEGCSVVAHNAPFDTSFIREAAKRLDLPFKHRVLDTLFLARKLLPKMKSHKLNLVAKELGVSLENHHRALYDATATADIFLILEDMQKKLASEVSIDGAQSADSENKVRNPLKPPEKEINLKQKYYHIIILARNYTGLKNLYKLVSEAHLNYFYKKPLIPKSVLLEYREGLIIGSACEQGEVYRAILNNAPDDEIEYLARLYDYLEIQPLKNNEFLIRLGEVSGENDLVDINKRIVALGDKLNKPTVATCDVHFLSPADEVYRRVLFGGQNYKDADSQPPLYLRTTDEMLEEFSYLGEEKAYEVVVANTNKIAEMIEDLRPVPEGAFPPEIEGADKELVDMCERKARDIYGEDLPDIVRKRIDKELNSILKYGFSVMYVIAQKLVKKSNDDGYLVGSRGSVGSSLVAFLSGITEVNALCPHYVCPNCKHSEFIDSDEIKSGFDMEDKNCPNCGEALKKDGQNIPFETFLGFEGDKTPDIDLNFSGDYQAVAHKYVEELFGEGYVFRAGTIGTLAEKTAIGFAKKYFENKEITPHNAELKRVSMGSIGVRRTTGQHPGGIIVVPKDKEIYDFCPIQHPADDRSANIITTHFDFHSIHDNLLKLDILGHDDPTAIRMLEDLTGVDAKTIPLDHKETMSLFTSTEALGVSSKDIGSEVGTFGIPEFGTKFVRQMLVDTKPKKFSELILISGLSHGTDVWLNNAQDLVKTGKCTLSEVICTRDDIMVYLIYRGLEPKMAFTIMESVRKGKGLTSEFEGAMREKNVPEWYIESCKRIKYMFPKAHATAYVCMAFRIAYFKVMHPQAFYMTYFTVRADVFDAEIMTHGIEKVRQSIRDIEMKGNEASVKEKDTLTILELCLEMYARGIEFLPIDLYNSDPFKFLNKDGAILPPLTALQGLGDSVAQNIAAARKDGEFFSVEEFKQRTRANKSVIEILDRNGCLEGIPESSQISLF